jgi:hypothetical protein
MAGWEPWDGARVVRKRSFMLTNHRELLDLLTPAERRRRVAGLAGMLGVAQGVYDLPGAGRRLRAMAAGRV